MSGPNLLIDTNIALYLLSGNKTVADILDDSTIYVSFITQLELLGYKEITPTEHNRIKQFLDDCIIVDINDEIKKNTISIKQKLNMKLPDSIIAGTALFLNMPLLTADKQFSKISKLNLALYEE
jgi:predicted nucleic acid-binding protein